MSSNAEPEKQQPPGIDEHVAEEMERIDDEFLNGLRDRRLESGVPEEELSSDLEFVQMSGLTYRDRDDGEDESAEAFPRAAQTQDDSAAQSGPPISFYEKGVGDVDSDMSPEDFESRQRTDTDAAREAEDASPIAELRDIIADLSRDISEPSVSGAEAAGLDESERGSASRAEIVILIHDFIAFRACHLVKLFPALPAEKVSFPVFCTAVLAFHEKKKIKIAL